MTSTSKTLNLFLSNCNKQFNVVLDGFTLALSIIVNFKYFGVVDKVHEQRIRPRLARSF